MPFCPQCSAEYMEGIATCPACEVALVEARPRSKSAVTPREVDLFRPAASADYSRGFRYAGEALRLLWKHPGLLLLPLLVVCFNATERTLENYLTVTFTTKGRQLQQDERDRLSQPSSYSPYAIPPSAPVFTDLYSDVTEDTLNAFRLPIPGPQLYGLRTMILTAARPASPGFYVGDPPRIMLLKFALPLVLELPFTALFLAGYYGLLRYAIARKPSPPRTFPLSLHGQAGIFFLFLMVRYVIRWGSTRILNSLPSGNFDFVTLLYGWSLQWTALIIGVLLALGLIVIAQENVGIFTAMWRSIRTVVRDFSVTLTLLLLLFLCFLPLRAGRLSASDFFFSGGHYTPQGFAGGFLLWVIFDSLFLLVGVWLVLAQFLWYRDANQIPVMPITEGRDATPTEA